MPAPEIIAQLVQKFDENRAAYRSGKYNEARLRQEFLDKFFEALGWDVYNTAGVAPEYADVVVEDSLEIEGAAKAPDYAFKIGRERKFYVEAKKPAVKIETDIHPAYQLRRYAWNAHLPLSILTDFEELAIYNCKNKPSPSDSAATGRDKFYKYTEYVEKWDEIAAVFSREAVWKGSFDRFAESSKGKKGTTEVDDAFLKDIEDWRLLLARNIALRNPQVADERQLNFAVQMTIDRMLFLRICEDKGIEPEEQLKTIAARPGIYAQLLELFGRADMKYNSGLFHLHKENSRDVAADTFTPALKVDDKVLKEIIASIYYPCPYIFKEIPVEILGQVYEQFLGKVIRLTAGHQAKVEEKPEVRKAGGVYYTPKYIVDYIVANTVGKLLENKTPAEAAELKIVDPACGSGSFLLGAFQYLLDWHIHWYLDHDPEKWAKGKSPALVAADGKSWKLTTAKKKEILVNNIHGVDIDAQAVEVTKLSLLLKVLEAESGQLSLGLERVLPDLGKNIQCGNSLIGPDYYADEQLTMFDDAERYRVNAFDWHSAFPQVFARADLPHESSEEGFDAVIGNPPYVRQESLGEDKKYYQQHYQVYAGTADLYSYFIEKGVSLLAPEGQFSYIVANKWMRANYGESLRKWLKTKCIEEITDFGDLPVFENATTYPCIIRISNREPHSQPKVTIVKALSFHSLSEYVASNFSLLDQTKFSDEGWSLSDSNVQNLFSKLSQNSISLNKFVNGKIFRGVLTGLNEAFVIDSITREKLISEDPKSAEIIKPFLAGRDIKRFKINWQNKYLIFTRHGIEIKKYPAIYKYLSQYKERLMPKPKNFTGTNWIGRKPGSYQWYEIQDSIDYYQEFEKPKIIYPNICKQPEFSVDTGNFYSNQKSFIISFFDLYLLGILNSKIMMFFFTTTIPKLRGDFYEPGFVFMKNFPVHVIDPSDPADVSRHDRIVALVQRMLDMHKRIPQTPQEQERLTRDIQTTDREIDTLVYQLYGLTDAEIKIVENG
jgi:hypothetical protein